MPSTPPPTPPTFDEVSAMIRQAAPGPLAQRMIDSLRRSVRITTRPAPADPPAGESHFGGLPDVPAGFEWPTCRGFQTENGLKQARRSARQSSGGRFTGSAYHAKSGGFEKPMYDKPKPLSLLSQFNLADLPANWDVGLPADGQLLVFCDMGDTLVFGGAIEPHDRWRVYWIPTSAGPPAERAVPGGEEAKPARLSLEFHSEWTIYDDLRYQELNEDAQAVACVRKALTVDVYGHRLMGHANPVQGNLGYGAEETLRQPDDGERFSDEASEEAQVRWRSLLQLDEEKALNWSWGDAGLMYFSILDEDLTQRRFDRVMAELQCH